MKTLTRTVMLSMLIAVTGLALVTSTGISQNDQPLEGMNVEQANASWVSAAPVSQVFKQMLEELGASVQLQQFSSNGLAYQAIDLNDLDFWANGWFPLHNPQLPGEFSGKMYDAHCTACTVEGYLADIPSIEEFEITSLEDFRGNDELKQAFDENGDGKADIFGCPPGWGCNGVIEDHFALYDWFGETFNHVNAAYSANFSTAQARIENGQGALFYTWAPNNTVLQLVPGEDVKYVNLVEDVEDLQKASAYEELSIDALRIDLGDDAVTSPVNLGFAAGSIHAVASENFSSNAVVDTLLSEVRLNQQWINEATLAINEEGADADELAAQWIEDNRDTVDEWLNAARSAAVR